MRLFPVLLALACTAGPDTDTDPLEPPPWPDGQTVRLESVIIGVPNGMALGPDFLAVGAAGRTLRLNPAVEAVTGDVEAQPNYPEEVVAAGRKGTADVALVRTPTDLRLVAFDPAPGGISDFFDQREVRFATWTGTQVLDQYRYEATQCGLRWMHQEDPIIEGLDCGEITMSVVDEDTVVVGLGRDGVLWVDQTAATTIASDGLFVAWDAKQRLVWHAVAGETWVAAVTPEGEEVRRVQAGDAIQALTALGDRGEIVWSENTLAGSRLVRADGEGTPLESLDSERSIVGLDSDPAGTRIAVQRTGDVGTYVMD